MRGLRVAARTHLNVAYQTIESFGFRVYEFAIITSGTVFEDFVTVLHGRDLLKLQA